MALINIPLTGLWSTIRDAINSNFSTLKGSTGWVAYTDSQYTSGSPLSLVGGDPLVNLPNNSGSILDTFKPSDISQLYDGSVITGRVGDGINLTISFAVRPTTAQPTRITTVPDIGGGVGEIEDYKNDILFGKGQNVVQRYLSSYNAYTLDTWEENGATMKIQADQNCEIFGIRYLITAITRG